MLIAVERKNGICIVRFFGRFLTGTDPDYLSAKTEEIRKLRCGKVLADFRQVPQIGSTGLGFLIDLYNSVVESGGRFVLAGLQGRVQRVLEFTHLSTVIPLAPDIASGLATLGGKGLTESGNSQGESYSGLSASVLD